MPERSSGVAWHSLRVRLPLIAVAVSIIAPVAFLWIAYREMEATLVGVGGERATVAADQVADLLAVPLQAGVEGLRRAAGHPDLRRYLQTRTDGAREAARVRLTALATTGPRRVELWSATGSREIEIAVPAPAAGPPLVLPAVARLPPVGLSALQWEDDALFFDVVAEIPAEPSSPGPATPAAGYLLVRSTFTINPPGLIARLLGNDAAIGIGNTSGGVWTDLTHGVPPPPVDLARAGAAGYRGADGQPHLGALSPIRGTPWAVWAEFPRSAIVAPARSFLRRMSVIAVVFVALGAAVLGSLSMRITQPLQQLEQAARQIAAGDYSQRVPTGRRDEIGGLGRAFHAMAEDVKDVHAIEEQNRRMLEASRVKSEFVANMSHELRTPLNAIIGFAELMHKGKVGPVSARHSEYLGDILSSSKHLLQLINDVLDLARVESGRMEFHPEPVDLAQLVDEVRSILHDPAASKHLAVEAHVDRTIAMVVIDRTCAKQILFNYLSNAIKFTAEGGAVAVRITRQDERWFRIEVEDTGVGIAPEDLGKLFVEFQQLDASPAKRYQGTGLGLALTKRLVDAQGGRVEVRSTLGIGSTFSAVLPRLMPTGDPGPARAPAASLVSQGTHGG